MVLKIFEYPEDILSLHDKENYTDFNTSILTAMFA